MEDKTENKTVVLITGASSGFGRLIGKHLAERGSTVYGTSRSKRPDVDGIHMEVLDVTDDQSVAACVEHVVKKEGKIDVLINNAGLTVSAPLEEMPLEVANEIMQTNFFGSARVTNAVLPHMRRQKSGKLIFISSLAGLVGTPGQGYYCASKHALEGYAETLRVELDRFDIHVSLVEPGMHRTQFLKEAVTSNWETISDYDGVREDLYAYFSESIKNGADPLNVASQVAQIVESSRPRMRYRVGSDARTVPIIKALLPESMFYNRMRRQFGA